MKKILFVLSVFLFAWGIVQPPAAEARVFVGVGVGCCGGYGGYPYPYYYPSYPYYAAPPPVVYTVPPPSPVYVAPTQAYEAPPPTAAAPPPTPAAASQGSPTFIDSAGHTCRHFQSTSGGTAYGTACLMPDGTWHTIQQQ